MEKKLTGWKAIVVVLAIIGFLIFKLNVQTEALQTEGVEEIRKWLVLESVRAVMPDMEKAVQAPTRNAKFLEQMADNLREENFQILSVTKRGVDRRTFVRAEVRHKGKSPSDGGAFVILE